MKSKHEQQSIVDGYNWFYLFYYSENRQIRYLTHITFHCKKYNKVKDLSITSRRPQLNLMTAFLSSIFNRNNVYYITDMYSRSFYLNKLAICIIQQLRYICIGRFRNSLVSAIFDTQRTNKQHVPLKHRRHKASQI